MHNKFSTNGFTFFAEPDASADPAASPAPAATGAGTTFTQEQVNMIAADRAKRAKEAAESALLKDLGITDPAEGKRILAEAKTASDARKSAEDLAKENESKALAAAASATAKADEKMFMADTKVALTEAGVAKDKLDRIRGLLTVKIGATEADIAADVAAVKKDFPELFAVSANGGMPDTDPGRGGRGTGKGNGEVDNFKAGMEQAKAEGSSPDQTPKLFAGIKY